MIDSHTWDAVRYLAGLLQARIRAVRGGDPQSGAVSLEWIIIAVGLAIVAGTAVAVFTSKVHSDISKLP
jgi:hypothetical protein